MIYKAITTGIDQARDTGLMREKIRVQLFADYTARDYVCMTLIPPRTVDVGNFPVILTRYRALRDNTRYIYIKKKRYLISGTVNQA